MQICSWSATEIIYSTKAIRRCTGAETPVWKGGRETHDECQSAEVPAKQPLMLSELGHIKVEADLQISGKSCGTEGVTERERKTYDLLI